MSEYTWYHGSPRQGLKVFVVDKEFQLHSDDTLQEGSGIYLTQKKDVAVGYAKGGSVYTVNTENVTFFDFSSLSGISSLTNKIIKIVNDYFKKHKFNYVITKNKFYDLDNSILSGKIYINDLGREILLNLDSDPVLFTIDGIPENYYEDLGIAIKDFLESKDGYYYLCRTLGRVLIVKRNADKLIIEREDDAGLV